MLKIWLSVVLLVASFCAGGKVLPDTVSLYFRLDVAELSAEATATLDSLVYYELLSPAKSLFIIGYADNLGADQYNQRLSEKRAQTVQDYLATLGIKKTSVKICAGRGEVKRAEEIKGGYLQDRRVDIVVADKAPPGKPFVKTPVSTGIGNTELPNVKIGQTLVLRNIYFHAGRHVVREESQAELEKLYSTMKAYPRLKIKIEGHVCCVPGFTDALDEDTFEQALSVNRARYIYNYLLDKGIDKDRLSYAGFGRTRPVVAFEKTLADEDSNRRVEIRVLEN